MTTSWLTRSRFITIMSLLALAGCHPDRANHASVITPYFGSNHVFYRRASVKGDSREWDLKEIGRVVDSTPLRKHDPFTVILEGVYIPASPSGRPRNIAVVLDIQSGPQKTEPRVVYYQRRVVEAQALNFRDLTIYSEPSWQDTNAPWFHIQVWEVAEPADDSALSVTLSAAESATRALGGLFPSPIIPLVASAIKAASFVTDQMRGNIPLLDYQLQFHPEQTLKEAGTPEMGADVAVFQTGTWVLIGRPPKAAANYWDTNFRLKRSEPVVVTDAGVAHVPAVVLTVARTDQQVPSAFLKRSEALVAMLAKTEERSNSETLDQHVQGLARSVEVYRAYQELAAGPAENTFRAAVGVLLRGADMLTPEEEGLLIGSLQRFTDLHFGGLEDFRQWWQDGANMGTFDRVRRQWRSPTLQGQP